MHYNSLTLGACTRGLQYSFRVCVCVCYEFADFISTLYDKINLPASFSQVFLGFQLVDFDTNLSVKRYRCFHAHSVVANPQTVHDLSVYYHVVATLSI